MAEMDVSSGVQALVDRLREHGVQAGREQGEALVAEARAKAQALRQAAEAEADRIVAEARARADQLEAAGREALGLAKRDAVLELREALVERFTARIQHLVGVTLKQPDVLQQLVLQIAGRVGDEQLGDHAIDVVLPRDVVELGDIRKDPDGIGGDALAQAVLGLAAEMLREGVTLQAGPQRAGVVVRLTEDRGVAFDLTDEGLTALLMRHLRPRFRALLEGVVR